MNIKFAYLSETATEPSRKNPTDAGIDLYADIIGTTPIGRLSIHPNEYAIVRTGITVELPKNHFGWITNKSRNNFLIGGGIVDEGYQGELLVKVINPTHDVVTIKHRDAIAQLIILPITYFGIENIDIKDMHTRKSDRGGTGGITRQYRNIDISDQYSYDFDDEFFDQDLLPDGSDGLSSMWDYE